MKHLVWILPIAAFIVLVGFLATPLIRGADPHIIPSVLIDTPAPDFKLGVLDKPGATFSPADMKGRVWLLNVWASWCESCREEHPMLVEFSRISPVPMVGMDYKDIRGDLSLRNTGIDEDKPATEKEDKWARERASQWLQGRGNPYALTVLDLDGRVGIDYGLSGVPETFVIDKNGVIRYKEIGAITPEKLKTTILPLIEKLQAQS